MANILIADNDDLTIEMLQRQLSGIGHNIIMAKDGADAIDKILYLDLDIAIIELHLKKIDGFDILKQLQSQGSKLPVMVISANVIESNIKNAMRYGCAQYIPKPIDMPKLESALSAILETKKDED